MNIITKDTRSLTDVTPINFQSNEIVFYDMKITGNFAKSIEDMVKGNFYVVGRNTKKISFQNNSIALYDMQGNFFVVEYTDKMSRDNDIQLLKQHFQSEGKFAKTLEESRQIPVYDGYFDYDGKYYTIVDGLNALTNEINPKEGIYKGVIVHPAKYFQVENQIKNVKENIQDTI